MTRHPRSSCSSLRAAHRYATAVCVPLLCTCLCNASTVASSTQETVEPVNASFVPGPGMLVLAAIAIGIGFGARLGSAARVAAARVLAL